MKNYTKLGLAALAIIIIVLILWFTGVFGGAEHNINNRSPDDSVGCAYPTPSSSSVVPEYKLDGTSDPNTRNIYGFHPALSPTEDFFFPQAGYERLGGLPALYSSYLAYIGAIADSYTDDSLGEPYDFDDVNFFSDAISTPFLTPSQYADNAARAAIPGLPQLTGVAAPDGCGVNAWSTNPGGATCNNTNAVNHTEQGVCRGPVGTVLVNGAYVCASGRLNANNPSLQTLPYLRANPTSDTALANCGAETVVDTRPVRQGCVYVDNTITPTCNGTAGGGHMAPSTVDGAGVQNVAHPIRVQSDIRLPPELTASTLNAYTPSGTIAAEVNPAQSQITTQLPATTNLLTPSSAEVAANNLRTSGNNVNYMCCQTVEFARQADAAENALYMQNKNTVILGRQAEIARLEQVVVALQAMTSTATQAIRDAQNSVTTTLGTKRNHAFTQGGIINA